MTWSYDAPYDVYDMTGAEPDELLDPAAGFHAVLACDELIGFRSFGPDGRVPGWDYDDTALDTGGGLRPSFTGQGFGRSVSPSGSGSVELASRLRPSASPSPRSTFERCAPSSPSGSSAPGPSQPRATVARSRCSSAPSRADGRLWHDPSRERVHLLLIVAGDLPGHLVPEIDDLVAFLDTRPVSKGTSCWCRASTSTRCRTSGRAPRPVHGGRPAGSRSRSRRPSVRRVVRRDQQHREPVGAAPAPPRRAAHQGRRAARLLLAAEEYADGEAAAYAEKLREALAS